MRFLWRIFLTFITNQEKIMATLQDVLDHITSAETEGQKVVALVTQLRASIDTLSQELRDAMAANDPALIQQIIDRIDADKAKMDDLIAANQPPAP